LSSKERESERAREIPLSLALPLLFRSSPCRRVTLGATAVPDRPRPGCQNSSGRRHAGEFSLTPQPSFPAYCLSSSSLGRNCAAEPRLYQRFCHIWTSLSQTPSHRNSVTTAYAPPVARATQGITVDMLLDHRDTLRSREGHKQRELTLSRFALRAARQIIHIRNMVNTSSHFSS
jgi:hypothetical protein